MKTTYLLLLAAALIGCKKEFTTQHSLFSDGRIAFGAATTKSRGVPVEVIEQVTYFNVISYIHNGSWASLSASQPPTLFMNNIKVDRNNDGTWSYSPLQYWASGVNTSFFAYYPAPSTDNGVTVTIPVDGTEPVLTYQVPEAVQNQPDILVPTISMLDRTKDNSTSGVNFPLAHALTCVSFKASGNGERITAVTISGIASQGSLALNGAIDWNVDALQSPLNFSAGLVDEVLTPDPTSIMDIDGYLMMLPQQLTDNAQLTVTIDQGDKTYDKTFQLNINGFNVWAAGQFIEYNLSVSPTGMVILNPGHITLQSMAGSSSVFAIVCPNDNPNIEWSVSVPDGGWLQIFDNSSRVNDQTSQTSPYQYSGKGSKLLYAYASSQNNSYTDERLSVISLDGSTSQQITVKQLFIEEAYMPGSSNNWAGSNIYWVSDNTYPDGGYLTFSDKDDRTNENFQGVYFMWGSLVAQSTSQIVWNSNILFTPNKDVATNGGWDSNSFGAWKYIPRLGWSNSANPAGGGDAIVIPQNNNQNYLYQNHNPQKNLGDICKYITDKGWAPGVHQGRKWRMPVRAEYMNPRAVFKKLGASTPQLAGNGNGRERYNMGFEMIEGAETVFFPASGMRLDITGKVDTYSRYNPGEAFAYWSSSPNAFNDKGADAFYYWAGIGNPVSTQGFTRDCGHTVRCVEELY